MRKDLQAPHPTSFIRFEIDEFPSEPGPENFLAFVLVFHISWPYCDHSEILWDLRTLMYRSSFSAAELRKYAPWLIGTDFDVHNHSEAA